MSSTVIYNRPNLLGRCIELLAEKKLSNRIKRLIYIASIIGLVKDIKDPETQLISKINSIFKIANYPNAVAFPMYVKSLIWRNLSSKVIPMRDCEDISLQCISKRSFSDMQKDDIANFFISNTPMWIKYDDETAMKMDIDNIISKMHLLD